jgi:hypothetical protein
MIQKQSNIRRSRGAHNHQEQRKGEAGPEINREHAHCFFDMKKSVQRKSVPPNTTVNSDFYCDVFRRLRENVRWKGPELWRNHNWLLHHDNAPAHTSLKPDFVTTWLSVPILTTHRTYPLWFRFVSQIENETEGTAFWKSVRHLKGIASVLDSIKENDFHCAFEGWKKLWDRYMLSQWD